MDLDLLVTFECRPFTIRAENGVMGHTLGCVFEFESLSDRTVGKRLEGREPSFGGVRDPEAGPCPGESLDWETLDLKLAEGEQFLCFSKLRLPNAVAPETGDDCKHGQKNATPAATAIRRRRRRRFAKEVMAVANASSVCVSPPG